MGWATVGEIVDVFPKGSTSIADSPNMLAQMRITNDTPIISYSFGDNYLFGTNLGYTFSLGGFFNFKSDRQSIDGHDPIDLGNSVEGQVAYLSLIPSYTFGANDNSPDSWFRIGAGVTAGYLNMQGDVYLTENQEDTNPACNSQRDVESIQQNCEKLNFSINQFTYGTSYLVLTFRG